MTTASVRYRMIYPAAMISKRGWICELFETPQSIMENIDRFDAIIVVKRLDAVLLNLVSAAEDAGVPIILDLCDDVLDQDYRQSRRSLFRMVFDAVAPRITWLVTTGDHLANRFSVYGFPAERIVIIPDCIESPSVRDLGRSFYERQTRTPEELKEKKLLSQVKEGTSRALTALRHPRRMLADTRKTLHMIRYGDEQGGFPSADAVFSDPDFQSAIALKGRKVIWFGNHGGPHSDFGMLTLLRIGDALRKAHSQTPFTLVVVSNHRQKWERFIQPMGVPSIYVDWTHEGAQRLLENSDAFIMPTGQDTFSLAKSANRAILALDTRIPVVASPLASLSWMNRTVEPEFMADQLVEVLSDRASARATAIVERSAAHERFGLTAIADSWVELIESAKPIRTWRGKYGTSQTPEKLLVVINNATDLLPGMAVIDAARENGIEVGLIVSAEGVHRNPRLIEDLIERRISPTFVERGDLKRDDYRWLRNASAMFCPSESSDPAHRIPHRLTQIANSAGVRTYTAQHGLENVGLSDPERTDVIIRSSTIFTWQKPEHLPDWVPRQVRQRCIGIGRISGVKKATRTVIDPLPDVERPVIGLFENLHWKKYTEEFKKHFADAALKLAAALPDRHILLVPHPAGLWSIKHFRPTQPVENLSIFNPALSKNAKILPCDLLSRCEAVITTPSTIAVDSAELGVPFVIMSPQGWPLSVYEPLPHVTTAEGAVDFIKTGAEQAGVHASFLCSIMASRENAAQLAVEIMVGQELRSVGEAKGMLSR